MNYPPLFNASEMRHLYKIQHYLRSNRIHKCKQRNFRAFTYSTFRDYHSALSHIRLRLIREAFANRFIFRAKKLRNLQRKLAPDGAKRLSEDNLKKSCSSAAHKIGISPANSWPTAIADRLAFSMAKLFDSRIARQ